MRGGRLSLLGCMLVLAVPGGAAAQGIYRYVEDGVIIYTNVPPPGVQASKVKGTFRPSSSGSGAAAGSKRRARTASAGRAPRPVAVQKMSAGEYDAHIDAAARKYNIPQPLLWAVMHAESNFDPKAVSHRGASGLMQLMPATAEQMYVKDIFDIRENIYGGARYLRVLANHYQGDMVKMLAAYNAGPEAVKKYGGAVPPYAETQAYVRKVVDLYFQYKERLASAAPAK